MRLGRDNSFLFGLLATANLFVCWACDNPARIRTSVTDYRVFYDNQSNGYGTIFGSLAHLGGATWMGVFSGGGKYQDDEMGMKPFVTTTSDVGFTWSSPTLFAPELQQRKCGESTVLRVFGPTRDGTLITIGYQYHSDDSLGGYYDDVEWRSYRLLIGRKPQGISDFTYETLTSGTFLGEQFVEGGIQLPDGRIVLTIWGAKNWGENWRCGILLSDDDGQSWAYRDVAYEADLAIRDKPDVVAGFNEQTLFLDKSGKLISIIRGREKLGRLEPSLSDTWFFRAESMDRGETWSAYEQTDLVGTGGPFGEGVTLPDGSLLSACRVPYSREVYSLPDAESFGLHIVRSFDGGRSWRTEHVIQRDPEGRSFHAYYNVMNGQFVRMDDDVWLYQFGQFDEKGKVFRILSLRIVLNDNDN